MPRCARLLCLFVCLYLPACLVRADVPLVSLFDSLPKNLFVTSMCRGLDGAIWVGTEDNGVYRIQPGNKITQFTSKDGIGQDNDIYALCCDRLGRIWAGTLRSGVAVYKGKEWKTYGQLDGSLGSRVFALTISPLDGDVWISTEAGLARYSEKRQEALGTRHENSARGVKKSVTSPKTRPSLDSGLSTQNYIPWRYYTRAEGLPSDQAQALAFSPDGTLYVGTQCDGIAIGSPKDNYRAWRVVKGTEKMPDSDTGTGLPTNLINCLFVNKLGRVYAGTTTGLAWSDDRGANWQYLRGADWKAKVEGFYVPSGSKKPESVEAKHSGDLLLEDYITCLAEDDAGSILVGHRQKGVEVRNPVSGWRSGADMTGERFVTSLLHVTGSGCVVGRYMGALTSLTIDDVSKPVHIKNSGINASSVIPPFPAYAASPTIQELNKYTKDIEEYYNPTLVPPVCFEGDDLNTGGNWLGRYGKSYAVLSAALSPLDYEYVSDPEFKLGRYIGPNCTPDDTLRAWVHWKTTDQGRCLYAPSIGARRQAEWDDHGETYPLTHEGPDIWLRIQVPAGVHRASVYLVNKDGHEWDNRFRDYLLEIKAARENYPMLPPTGKRSDYVVPDEVVNSPSLLHARVKDFWGGVYKRFIVQGPGDYFLKISKNNSLNSLCSAVFLDKLRGPKSSWDGNINFALGDNQRKWPMGNGLDAKTEMTAPCSDAPLRKAAYDLLSVLSPVPSRPAAPIQSARLHVLAYRALLAARSSTPALVAVRRDMPLYLPDDREAFMPSVLKIWDWVIAKEPLFLKYSK